MASTKQVLLNIDAGEYDDEPAELYAIAHFVSVACGGHAGDARSMERVLRACKACGTRVGAHPSYDDRDGFGRRELAVGAAVVAESVQRQCRALQAVAARVGIPVAYVKPHGALYHAANRDRMLAHAVLDAAATALADESVTFVGPPGGELERWATAVRRRFAREGFADRGERPDGTLVPRGEVGALVVDPEAARLQARRLLVSGRFDTLCVHGDTPGAVSIARAVREELDGSGRAGPARELS
jgi:UPF0271 protein